MDWSNEDYVRLYTRETSDDLMLSWEALALWRAMLCKFDRSGLIDTRRGPRGLAALVRMPLEVVERALPELLSDGRVRCIETGYFAPNFLEAQSATKSDRQRQKESRESRASRARAQPFGSDSNNAVTIRDEMSHAVTRGHELSQPVTLTSADPDPLLSPAIPLSRETQTAEYPERHGMGPNGETAEEGVSSQETPQPLALTAAPAAKPRRAPRSSAPETEIPSDWTPRPEELAKARELGLDGNHEAAQFRDTNIAKGRKYVNWDAAFRTWIRRAPEYAKGGGNGARTQPGQHAIRRTTIL